MAEPWVSTVPDQCQQFGCRAPVETWCPLCRAFFCKLHDELYPARRHDCIRGRAEVTAMNDYAGPEARVYRG